MAERLSERRQTLAVISNPESGRNRQGALHAVTRYCQTYGIPHYCATTPAEVAAAIQALATDLPDILAINSGDGTINLVLAALQHQQLVVPTLALLRGGSTNMIHRDCGLRGAPARALARLHQRVLPTATRRPLLITNAVGQTQFGFFLALGAIPRVTLAVRRRLHSRGLIGRTGELLALAPMLWRLWRGALTHDALLAPAIYQWQADGQAQQAELMFFAATTLSRLLFGIRIQAAQAIGLLQLTAQRNLKRDSAATLAFTAAEDWVIDGEFQPPGKYSVRLGASLQLVSDA